MMRWIVAVALCLALAGPALAAGSNTLSSQPAAEDPDWAQAKVAVQARQYDQAVPLLQKVVAKDASNADAFNYLGYIHARADKTQEALDFYNKALAISSKHRGANAYLGELYLRLANLPAAEERLKVLDGACFFGCAEYDILKASIAEYKATGKFASRK
jgi:tetratricopeptide (TPR) repeat protein